ncbi:transcription initiation factor TFIID subunit 6 isoform X2 [Folsomia candida]|uniref:transcription initiation factor TFIID subunit 6 isoform X2 n=1 Tax=Folsomia candida TaxID=158441 RepID=UPI0016052EDA|nr:transcription initiation factor TFIID subunit 6 isoform X2 [Folsomia candida]
MGDKESSATGTVLFVDSIKSMAESVGVANLEDEAAKELAEDVSYRLKLVVQDAVKFMEQARRTKLTPADIDYSLKIKNIEPLYGFQVDTSTPFRFASGGGRELHFMEEKEVDIHDVVGAPIPKIPADIVIRSHWLAIEGRQPAIPENPPPQSIDLQRSECVDPASKLAKGNKSNGTGSYTPTVGKPIKFKSSEQVFVKQLATHELSVEQQLYYKEITEACVGSEETRRTEALQSLTNDPGLYEMLPRLCTFIAEGVRVNVVQCNLALLIYLMRMVRALLDNQTLYLEKYLHEIIPSVATCIVSKQLCGRPEHDNHWALRDFAARLIAQICKTYNTSTNNVQTRITRIFCTALINEKSPLSSVYGSIVGLCELGPEVIKTFVIPKLKDVGDRLELCLEGVGHTQADKASCVKIRHIIAKYVAPIVKSSRPATDTLEDYKTEFGYLAQVLKTQDAKAPSSTPAPGILRPTPQQSIPATQQHTSSASKPVMGAPPVPVRPTTPTTPTLPKFTVGSNVVVNSSGLQQQVTINLGEGDTYSVPTGSGMSLRPYISPPLPRAPCAPTTRHISVIRHTSASSAVGF